MDPLFQHLKPAPAPSDDSAKAKLAHLMDLDRHLGAQTAPRLLTDPVTRRKTLAAFTLPAGAADSSPYDPDYPSSLTPVEGLSEGEVQDRTISLVNRLGDSHDLPVHGFRTQTTGSVLFQSDSVLGYAAGVDLSVPFRVAHLGGRRWRVSGGSISGGGREQNEQDIPGRDVTTDAGFIGFWASVTPVRMTDGSLPYSIDPSGLSAEDDYEQAGPTRALPPPDSDELDAWSSGRVFIPLAWVSAPTASAPAHIVNILGGANLVFEADYTLGWPLVSPELPDETP
jgi:hypothetical protein